MKKLVPAKLRAVLAYAESLISRISPQKRIFKGLACMTPRSVSLRGVEFFELKIRERKRKYFYLHIRGPFNVGLMK